MDHSPKAQKVEAKLDNICLEEKQKPKKWYKRISNRIIKFGCKCMSGEKIEEVYVKTTEEINDHGDFINGDDSQSDEDKTELPPIVFNQPSLQELAAKVAQDYVDALLKIQKGRARRRCGFKKVYDREYGFKFE